MNEQGLLTQCALEDKYSLFYTTIAALKMIQVFVRRRFFLCKIQF
jgi:hypothetical protein